MLQHVSIEIPPAEAERTVEFWALLGFTRVEPPEPLAGYVTWLERQGTQIHLIHTEEASVPVLGHAGSIREWLLLIPTAGPLRVSMSKRRAPSGARDGPSQSPRPVTGSS